MTSPFPPPGPIEAVVFDFHTTLYDAGDPARWLEAAWRLLGWPGAAAAGLPEHPRVCGWLDRIWEHAEGVDPPSSRDLSPARHREVYDATIALAPGVDSELADALYDRMVDLWEPYDDAAEVLAELRHRGIKTAVLSNIGMDLRPTLRRSGLLELLDAVVLSYEVGAVKPQPEIFAYALDRLGTPAAASLMVGDNWTADGGAAGIGMRVLILPRTSGPVHGLDAVLGLVERANADSSQSW